MKSYEVTIYPVTPWKVQVRAKNKAEAKKIALELEGPTMFAYPSDHDYEWQHDIMEWPNVSDDEIEVEEI